MERLQQQLEGALQRDRLVERQRHGRVAADGLLLETDHVEVNGDVGLLGQRVDHGGEGLLTIGGLHGGIELLVDGQFGGGRPGSALRKPLRPRLCQVLPVFGVGKLDRTGERRRRALDILGHVEEARLPLSVDRPLRIEPTDHAALGEQLPHHRVVGGELPGLLGDCLGLGKPPLVDERVVFLDQHRDPLVDLAPLSPLAVDLRLDLGALFVEGEFGPPLAGRLLDVAPGPLDPPQHLGLRVDGERLVVESLRGEVEQVERVGGRLLGEPLRLELLRRHLGRDAGEQEAVGRCGIGGGRFRPGGSIARAARLADCLLDHSPGRGRVARGAAIGGRKLLRGSRSAGPPAGEGEHHCGHEAAGRGRQRSARAELESREGDAWHTRSPSCGKRNVGREKYPRPPPGVKAESRPRKPGQDGQDWQAAEA